MKKIILFLRSVFVFIIQALQALFDGGVSLTRKFAQFFIKEATSTRFLMHMFMVSIGIVFSVFGLFHSGEIAVANEGFNQYIVPQKEITTEPIFDSMVSDGYLIKTNASTTVMQVGSVAGIKEYVIQPGDTLGSIAQEFGVSQKTIQWENQIKNVNALRPGQTLTIPPDSGIIQEVGSDTSLELYANKYEISVDEIIAANNLIPPIHLSEGQKLILPISDDLIPTIEPPKPVYTATTTTTSYSPIIASTAGSGQFIWPTTGRITQTFYQHPRSDGAIDIANRSLPPIYASDGGTVVYAGWDSTGYGNRIDINHGNGFVTRYAHLSEVYVGSGQQVVQGEMIGKMGSTGHSSGPHVHFMIIWNGTPMDPLQYL